MLSPITPEKLRAAKIRSFPPEVFIAWNTVLVEKSIGSSPTITVTQEEAIQALIEVAPEYTGNKRAYVYEQCWLDIEEAYREAGWIVVYDKPAYGDSYEAYFTFTPKG